MKIINNFGIVMCRWVDLYTVTKSYTTVGSV